MDIPLGMFIVDEFEYRDAEGNLLQEQKSPQVSLLSVRMSTAPNLTIFFPDWWWRLDLHYAKRTWLKTSLILLPTGTYAAVGARMFLQPQEIGMVIDKGYDFPADILESLSSYGKDMWLFRERQDVVTTRAINKYVGQHRG